jgi:L-ribulose-5-phosphate 3-epimerase
MNEPSRREFLSNAVAAASLAAASSLVRGGATVSAPSDAGSSVIHRPLDPAPVARASARTLRKAVMIGMVGEGENALEKFQIIRDCGFEGVEIDSPTPSPTDEILAAQEKTGVKIHGLVNSVHWKWHMNSPSDEVRTKAREAMQTCFNDARKYGSSSILLVPAVVNSQQPYDQAYTITQKEIRTLLPLAKETGVQIAVENVWNNFLLSPLEAARYIDEFNDPLVRFHFDIGNVINFGYPDQWIRVLGPRIAKLHIKDFSRKKRDDEGLWKGFSVELGDGDAGWAAVMKALDDVGYSTDPAGRWATAEVGGGDRTRLKKISDQMDRLLAT